MAGSTTNNAFYVEMMNIILLNGTTAGLASGFFVGLLLSSTSAANAILNPPVYQEVLSGRNYARMAMNRSTTSTGSGASAASGWSFNSNQASLEYSNLSDIVFGVPQTADWGTIGHIGLFKSNALQSLDMMYFASLTSAKVVNNGDGAPKILAGQLRIARASC